MLLLYLIILPIFANLAISLVVGELERRLMNFGAGLHGNIGF